MLIKNKRYFFNKAPGVILFNLKRSMKLLT